ncbi:MAG: glycosyltransferase family 2 protein [Lachnospiraceae bacterium]|nr:glycosyltransferase family 2 protein [Lachnospiraceae bacterium]
MRLKQKELLIIIPAYNEGKTIGALLEKLEQPEIAKIADVLVMNDASKDDTADVVRARNHTVITHVYNLGYGSGLQVGYKYAYRRGYQYVIQMDADGQHDACNVPVLYERLKTADEAGKYPDIVIGSRFLEGSKTFPISAVKKLAITMFRMLIKLGTGKTILDPTSGLQGLSRRAFGFYAGFGHFDDKYPDANMIMQMLLLGFQVEEVPSVMHARTEGVSMHSGLKPIKYMFRMMFSIIAVWVRIRLYKVDVGAINEDSVT